MTKNGRNHKSRTSKDIDKSVVEGTNDFSIVSKLSAAQAGYFKDEFLSQFANTTKKRSPLINWGYYLRFKSLELTFEKCTEILCQRGDKFQILSLGAGFDTTYFRLYSRLNSPENLSYFEVDLPDNVSRKTKLVSSSNLCTNLLRNPDFLVEGGIVSQFYTLVACDLANQSFLYNKLLGLGFNFNIPTLVLSECVITYMEEKDSTNLIKFLSPKLPHAIFFVYEQILPYDGFGQFMVNHFTKLQSPIKGVIVYPTVMDQQARYLKAGWGQVGSITLSQVLSHLSLFELTRIRGLEQFDEYEELHLYSSHYIVVIAANGLLCSLLDQLDITLDPLSSELESFSTPQLELLSSPLEGLGYQELKDLNVSRFGHSLLQTEDNVFVVGGFGVDGDNHKRLAQLLQINMSTSVIKVVKSPLCERMYAGIAGEVGGTAFISGGRLSPARGLTDILEVNAQGNIEISPWKLPHPLWRHRTALIGDNLIVVGGCSTTGVVREVQALNIMTGKWLDPITLERGVHSGSVVVWGDQLIHTGGLEGDTGEISSRVLSIRVSLENKLEVNDVKVQISPRFSHTSHVVDDEFLVLVGGVDQSTIEMISLITGQMISTIPVKGSLMLHNHQTVIKGRVLTVIGGGGNCFSFGTHCNPTVRLDIL